METRVRGLRAVETYLRNFEGEKARYEEILEITLCYGVQCLSRTFPLKGMQCDELRTITAYDAAKTRDFYVRNASPSIDKAGGLEVRTKPSHAWRDGEVEMPDFSKPSGVAETALQPAADSENKSGALHSLSPAFDEIGYLTKLLGKSLVDLTWKMFTGMKGSQITTMQELDEHFCRVDQSKTVATIPPLELPVTSFAEFLGMYVTECVRQLQCTCSTDNTNIRSGGDCVSDSEQESIYTQKGVSLNSPSLSSFKNGWQRSASTPRAVTSSTKPAETAHVDMGQKLRPPLLRQWQPRQVPCSFQQVQSKTQPELQTRRQKLLRVKETQSQRMAKAPERARLTEYDTWHKLKDVRDRRLSPMKIPISDVTTGAAALRIVDDFMKSSLMDTFGREDGPVSSGIMQLATNPTQPCSVQKDLLEEELYGTTALDNSILGCKHQIESQPKQPRRKYDKWLGDFGPLHTRTVRPEWNEDNAAEPDSRARGTMFEWNFEHPSRRNHKTADRLQAQTRIDREGNNKETRQINDFHDGLDSLGNAMSETSDPVFRWLEGAV